MVAIIAIYKVRKHSSCSGFILILAIIYCGSQAYIFHHLGLYKIFHPAIFQGNLKKKNYFEGWFLKHVAADQGNVLSVIPGIALNATDAHAFVQIIDGISGETHYIPYPLGDFQWDPRDFRIQVGNSVFSLAGVELNINSGPVTLSGKVDYKDPVRYPGTLFSPGIMGWYSYVPFMECYHGIVSANHALSGTLIHQNKEIDFSGGKGYIEKDWGTSFPEAWIWLQCNNFPSKDASLFISVAKIPWLGKFFMGFIAFLYVDGRYHLFSTYNKSRLSPVSFDGEELSIELKNHSHTLKTRVIKNTSGELKAPDTGNMSRRIKESNDSVAEVIFSDKTGNVIFRETGQRAGLEIVEKIFDYL
jgi:tocopherol cyclase